MPSSFFGFNIATSGLQAQQAALNTVGHNIANANNPNYKRQQVLTSAAPPFPYGGGGGTMAGQLGSGVRVTSIIRVRDEFIEGQLLLSNQSLGRWESSKQSLDQITGIIGEPTNNGLSSVLDKFWNSWQDLSQNSDNMAARSNVLEYGSAVASNLNRLYTQIDAVQDWQDVTIQSKVEDINRLASSLANLNDQIQRTLGAGDNPNDLLDERDSVLTQLSKIADVQVYGQGGASDSISIGGHVLVEGNRCQQLAVQTGSDNHSEIVWASDKSKVEIHNGELGGIMNVRENIIPGYLSSLDKIATTIMSRVNELHSAGYGLDNQTGRNFFEGTGAKDIRVSSTLLASPRLIAAGASADAPGDGSVALAIANVKNEGLIDGSTIGQVYSAFVSQSGIDASGVNNRLEAQTYLHQQIQTQQQSVSGVNLDEEMANMIRFQQAYNASARVMSVMDEMLDTLIERTAV